MAGHFFIDIFDLGMELTDLSDGSGAVRETQQEQWRKTSLCEPSTRLPRYNFGAVTNMGRLERTYQILQILPYRKGIREHAKSCWTMPIPKRRQPGAPKAILRIIMWRRCVSNEYRFSSLALSFPVKSLL